MVRADDKREYFEPRLADAFRYANSTRGKTEEAKKQARKDPLGAARRASDGFGSLAQCLRAEATKLHGVDIASPQEALKAFKVRDYLGMWDFLHRLNLYPVYEECQRNLQECARDATLSREELAEKVCRVVSQAEEKSTEVWLHMLNEQRILVDSRGSDESARIARNEEARRMAAHIATRTSSRRNLRLAKALDEIRGYDEPAGRERLKALLRELYIEAPRAWDEQRNLSRRLVPARTSAAKKIEGRSRQEPSMEAQLAAFASREALVTHAKAARLSPQELEAFALFIERPKLKYREMAARLGISTSQVGVIKHRIKRKLSA